MSDYIKREDVLGEFTYDDLDEYYTPQIMAIVGDIPSADVAQVRHGRWYRNDQDKLLMRIRCSICNKAIYSENYFAYCPNCGTRMDGGNDEIDRR